MIEKKLAEEGYKKYRINSSDTREDLAALEGIICLGTFSQSMMERIESFRKPTVLPTRFRIRRNLTLSFMI